MIAVVVAIVSAAQAVRRPGITATAAGPEVVEVGFGTAGGLIGHGGSGHARHRDSGKKGVSQKSSHLKSPWLVSVHGCVSLAGAKWFTEKCEFWRRAHRFRHPRAERARRPEDPCRELRASRRGKRSGDDGMTIAGACSCAAAFFIGITAWI
ncbi:hypothetical protein, partial [Mesorhizobium sp. M7A.F.Ca.CA.001.12.2.1]|uniref:hypothetical protein n=1 Tax=Mesorhizobium sp. M7A.F.Ca.CA.001.12.2.1 TaxID=2496725 RepID=UPI0019D03773